MRLDRIFVSGFKSFADKTEFRLDHNITAVVGPNGCGKSNIVDAVKWVLGEQSVKSLRSGQMADVIFAGSSSRKPAGMAEVRLCFSGVGGTLAVENDQLEVGRRLYRTGESEYLINNKVCRLKDVRELFMDTGVGVRAYSIMEQGQIEQLLHASKTDRRVIFEEAAGISKYKAHKKEAIRKLDRAEQNLLRVADILAEVQKQLRSVKLQAGKARNYLAYTDRLKELRMNFSLAEYADLTEKLEEKQAELDRFQENLGGIMAAVSEADTRLSELANEIVETENHINRSDNSLVSVRSQIEQRLERIKMLHARLSELNTRQRDAATQVDKYTQEKAQTCSRIERSRRELADSDEILEQKKTEAHDLEQDIAGADAACDSLAAQLEDEKGGIIDIVRRTAQLHNEIQSKRTYRDNLSGQKDRLANRANAAGAELQELLSEKAGRHARRQEIENVLAELKGRLDDKRARIDQLEQEVSSEDQQLAQKKEKRSALASELEVLADMEKRREGLSAAVKSILQEKSRSSAGFDCIQGLLADAVEADVEYAAAVEAALEGKTDALIVAATAERLAATAELANLDGRVRFLCSDDLEPVVNDPRPMPEGVMGRLVQFVRFQPQFAKLVWKLLGKTLVVSTLDEAVRVSAQLGPEYQVVTLAGQLLDGRGLLCVGPPGKSTGLISRKSRLRQLESLLTEADNAIAEMKTQQQKRRSETEHLRQLCRDLRTAIYEANTEKIETDSRLAHIEQNIKRLTDEKPLIASEITQLEEQIAQSVNKEYESKQKLEELEAINTQRNAHIQQLEAELAERRKQKNQQAARFTELRIEVGQIAEQRKAAEQNIEALNAHLKNLADSTEKARADEGTCRQQIAESERDILTCESEVSELFLQKEKAVETSSRLHEKVEQLLQQRKQTEQQVREKRSEQAQLEENVGQIKVELGQLDVKRGDLAARVQEELGIELAEAYQNYTRQDVQYDEVRNEIAELRAKIERLGNVNLDAISQQEELENRNEFLSGQIEDLNRSKGQLQQLIGRINRESREKFEITFEMVRTNFQTIFRKLFGGGKADILLEDPQDILESGIEIVARPPGKETRSISLLSGGEKAMTALALLFAIFESKPSPFCLLDEVDAALDEANNERFNMIVQDFESRESGSQFIVITHSKRTMSIADELIGVTMQAQGVSKKISVEFDRYEPAESAVA